MAFWSKNNSEDLKKNCYSCLFDEFSAGIVWTVGAKNQVINTCPTFWRLSQKAKAVSLIKILIQRKLLEKLRKHEC
jgi:hypothetical protein